MQFSRHPTASQRGHTTGNQPMYDMGIGHREIAIRKKSPQTMKITTVLTTCGPAAISPCKDSSYWDRWLFTSPKLAKSIIFPECLLYTRSSITCISSSRRTTYYSLLGHVVILAISISILSTSVLNPDDDLI